MYSPDFKGKLWKTRQSYLNVIIQKYPAVKVSGVEKVLGNAKEGIVNSIRKVKDLHFHSGNKKSISTIDVNVYYEPFDFSFVPPQIIAGIKSFNGPYLSSNHKGELELVKQPERWEIAFVHEGKAVTIRSEYGKYLCADKILGITGGIVANRIAAGMWETFELHTSKIGSVGAVHLKSVHGFYLSCNSEGKIKAKSKEPKENEVFYFLEEVVDHPELMESQSTEKLLDIFISGSLERKLSNVSTTILFF